MGDRKQDREDGKGRAPRKKRRRAPVFSSGDLPAAMETEDSVDESIDTQELLEDVQEILSQGDDEEPATLVDLGDQGVPQESLSGEESEEISGERSISDLMATAEIAASTDQASVEGSGSWIGNDTQEIDDVGFEEPSEDSAQTQSISEAITGEVSSTYEGSSGPFTDSDGWLDGPPGEQKTPTGPIDGPDDLAGYGDVVPKETTEGAPSTTSYDFNEENSGDMLGIILEESREFPELNPDNLPDPTGPLFPTEEGMGDTSQEIDELLGAEVSEAVREGVKALRRGDRQSAMRRFEQALRSDPDDPMAQAYLRLAQELYIRELVPGASLASVPRLRVGRKMLMTLDLTPEDGAVLALIDGATTLEELETMLAHMDRDTIYACLARAQENGHIEFMT